MDALSIVACVLGGLMLLGGIAVTVLNLQDKHRQDELNARMNELARFREEDK